MKIKIFFFLIVISNSMLAQKIENLKLRDTIYVLFDINENQSNIKLKFSTNTTIEEYMYIYNDTTTLTLRTSIGKFIKKDNFCKKKDFLVEKKDKIITLKDLSKTSFFKTVYQFEREKILIYLIDKRKNKRKKIYIKRAYMMNSAPINI